MSIALQMDLQDLNGVGALLDRLRYVDADRLSDEIGALVVSQTQERIANTKRGPDGDAWPDWSEVYAQTRHGGQSLLFAEGNPGLLSSLTHLVQSGGVEVGSNLVYAAHHQFGSDKPSGRGSGVPARPYLGISSEDAEAIERLCVHFVERLAAG
ncbi:MAG: phage virion morphogenesis protein [Kiritimatiellales bacterium]